MYVSFTYILALNTEPYLIEIKLMLKYLLRRENLWHNFNTYKAIPQMVQFKRGIAVKETV